MVAERIDLAERCFTDTVSTFAEYADDETLRLVPGHAYFLDPRPDLDPAGREARVARRLRLELLPLLRDYLDERLCGPAVRLDASAVGASGDRWVEPFLEANAAQLRRLGVSAAVASSASASCSPSGSSTRPRSSARRRRPQHSDEIRVCCGSPGRGSSAADPEERNEHP